MNKEWRKLSIERLTAYKNGWRQASEQLPVDIEARLFYVLSRLSTVSANDKSYTVQREVGAIAEKVLEEIPDHPGADITTLFMLMIFPLLQWMHLG